MGNKGQRIGIETWGVWNKKQRTRKRNRDKKQGRGMETKVIWDGEHGTRNENKKWR